ncbi:MAG: cation:dicarboxylase symporter family transporter [Steroidobacteraceae bacterium]
MSHPVTLLLALVAGFAGGLILRATGNAAIAEAANYVVLVGEIWLRALQMTAIPLLTALLITGIAGAGDVVASGRTAARSLALIIATVVGMTVLGVAVIYGFLQIWPVAPAAREALIAGVSAMGAGTPTEPPPPLREWLINVIPTNPFAATAQGAILSMVVFVMLFALAITRLPPERRAPLLSFFDSMMQAMMVMVSWVLRFAPVGAFTLALGVGLHGGAGAAGAIVQYVLLEVVTGTAIVLAIYPMAAIMARISPLRFARAVAPVQVVAASTQSSLASLPAMLSAAQGPLGVPPRVAGVTLPIAVSIFKVTSAAMNLAVVLFSAHVLGIPVTPGTLAAGFIVACLVSFGVAGLPGASSFFASVVPICLAMGVPTTLLALLIAVEVIPDLFRTVGNVTADVAVTKIVERRYSDSV